MRVLHLYSGNLFGGIETALLSLAKLARQYPSWQPIFGLCFEGRLSQELKSWGHPVYSLGRTRLRWPWTVWRARHRLRELLVHERPDIAICHSCWPHVLFAPVIRKRKVPLVFFAHGHYTGHHWLERVSRWTPPDLILANSSYTLSFLERLFPGARRELAYYPIEFAEPIDRVSNCSMIRRELRTPEDAVVIVTHSRLEGWKGHNLLLDALGCLSDVPRWACWITADIQRPTENVYLNKLRNKAIALGIDNRVSFVPHQSNVPAFLAAADIHCQPNTGPEPFGRVFVEALHARLPVVTTDLGAAPEIIDESCGILVPPNEPASLAGALLRLIRDPDLRAQLGSNGPKKAQQLCDPITQLAKWVAILSDLLDRRGIT